MTRKGKKRVIYPLAGDAKKKELFLMCWREWNHLRGELHHLWVGHAWSPGYMPDRFLRELLVSVCKGFLATLRDFRDLHPERMEKITMYIFSIGRQSGEKA
jgi:hypothetical protein